MKRAYGIFFLLLLFTSIVLHTAFRAKSPQTDSRFLTYTVDTKAQSVYFFWKDGDGKQFYNFPAVKEAVEKEGHKLVFAVNGGMFKKDFSPQGLYIEEGLVKNPLDTITKAFGNFYLQPNGVFYLLKDGTPIIRQTTEFAQDTAIAYATQSGPMLVIDEKIHPVFTKGSKNLNIRNGVGVLPNGKLLFVQSKEKVSFYDFASFFKERGCKNALYLDGFVSRTYLPEQDWIQMDGTFGVIIGVIE